MSKQPCYWGSHGEGTRWILLGCLQMLGFCTCQAPECTSSLQGSSAAPPWWRAQYPGQRLLLSTNTSKQGYILFVVVVVLPCTRTKSDDIHQGFPHLTQIPLFISKPLSLLLGTIFAQFLCSHINVAAFPWQVKQFTNTRKQIFRKRKTAIFRWSNRKKKNQWKNIDFFPGRWTLNELNLLIYQRTSRLKGLKMKHLKTNYFMLTISV